MTGGLFSLIGADLTARPISNHVEISTPLPAIKSDMELLFSLPFLSFYFLVAQK